jgi:predicted DNA binding CopG/RHH family protein
VQIFDMENAMKTPKIEGSVENWESGALGQDAAHAKRAPKELDQAVDDSLGLQAISIRLSKELIEDYKIIAKMHGIGYQPLMRDALKRFAESEYKRLAIEAHSAKVQHANDGAATPRPKGRQAA